MNDKKRPADLKKVDTKEFEIPETLFIRDIDNKVLQGIALECINNIDGITLVESNFINSIFGRNTTEGIQSIHAEQDSKNQSVSIKLEVSINYGISIPEKAEEIQTVIAEEINKITGLHVASVHVVFKSIVTEESLKNRQTPGSQINYSSAIEDYTDEF